MLRRKLLWIMVSLTSLLMLLAVAALWSLQGIFTDLDHLNNDANVILNESVDLLRSISTIEAELYALHAGSARPLDSLTEATAQLRRVTDAIGRHDVFRQPQFKWAYDDLVRNVNVLARRVDVLTSQRDVVAAQRSDPELLIVTAQLRGRILKITRDAQERVQQKQAALARRFRWKMIGIALGFLLVVNVSVLLLLRTAGMILRPVDKLIEASRHLANEDFEYRTAVGQNDEFDELARAFNNLAQQLQENKQRRLEVIQQVARTLNHELNNAIAIIDLQLHLMQRRSGGDASLEKCLRQIHDTLRRMTRAVEALKHVRRIIVTDYLDGVKMLDLERSIQDDPVVGSESHGDVSQAGAP